MSDCLKPAITAFACMTALIAAGCASSSKDNRGGSLSFPGEVRLENIRQLTSGGTNAEAYWSYDGDRLTFQRKGPGIPCDQIFTMNPDGSDVKRISNGRGRTTCSYFFPDDSRILFSSTQADGPDCPPPPDLSRGYYWPVYPSYQIFLAKPDATDMIVLEPGAPRAYNAEATTCKDGSVVFTSNRAGDLDLYTGKLDRMGVLTEIKRVTEAVGYDGGAFFSADCKKLIWRASRPLPGKETEQYKSLLRRHLVQPSRMEIWVANADGSEARQVTRFGAASFAPFFLPDGERFLFSSNLRKPGSRNFDLFLMNINGTGLEQVTFSGTFDSFPMLSPNGKRLAFSSNRNGKEPRETNVFVADWKDREEPALNAESKHGPDRFLHLVKELSSRETEGRGIQTEGILKAEQIVEDRFRKLGLRPFFETWPKQKGAGYKQPIEVQTGVRMDPEKTSLRAVGLRDLIAGQDFAPASFSSSGKFEGSWVDVGHGIVAPAHRIDDYKNLNLKNKVALIRRHTPASIKLSPEQEVSFGDLRYKAYLAREKGASAVIFWEADEKLDEGDFSKIQASGTFSSEAGLPVLFLRRSLAQELLHMSPRARLEGRVELTRETRTVHNVIGTLGKGCGKRPPVVLGAHLDHLGFGGAGSLEPGTKAIHPGADDNASGVAALVEAARALSAREDTARSSRNSGCWVFAAFTAEETGLGGSSALVRLFDKMKIRPKAMLNFDMVGRMRGNQLYVFGVDSAREWPKLVKKECEAARLNCAGGGDGFGPSDHMPFYLAGVPVLHLFTGNHENYHRSSDTWEKINATGGIQVAELAAALASSVGASATKLKFQKSRSNPALLGSVMGKGDRKSTGAYLGTVPDYGANMASMTGTGPAASKAGVKIGGTSPGSPADRAGVKAGDVLVEITELAQPPKSHQIQSLEDFTFVLRALQPGQKVELGIRRGDETLRLPAEVGRRPQ